jgi:hypothetical protein
MSWIRRWLMVTRVRVVSDDVLVLQDQGAPGMRFFLVEKIRRFYTNSPEFSGWLLLVHKTHTQRWTIRLGLGLVFLHSTPLQSNPSIHPSIHHYAGALLTLPLAVLTRDAQSFACMHVYRLFVLLRVVQYDTVLPCIRHTTALLHLLLHLYLHFHCYCTE